MRYSLNISQRAVRIRRFILFGSFLILFSSLQVDGESQNFPKQRLLKDHFVIYHDNRQIANDLGWRAEYYYKRILRHLGVVDFHPWEGESKCVILLFKTQDEYIKEMKAQSWSGGQAVKNMNLLATFEGTEGLETRILPHEMTHLILWEYFGKADIPLWFNEGMAQYEQEEQADYNYKKYILQMVREGKYIKLADLFNKVYIPSAPIEIGLFYAESASVIDYMRRELLQAQFSKFVSEIKKGQPVDEVLKEVYQWKFPKGIEDFERRWIEYVTTKY
ncbi:MAG: peptidase MA family metallohydrolase [Candidatus Omnitrophota bacterium]